MQARKDTRVENERRELMTVEECAAYTRLSRWTIYTFVCKKRIPYIKLGRRTLFDRAEIDRWIQSKSKKVSAVSLPRGVA
jgi:excisionase family DNA binding protein